MESLYHQTNRLIQETQHCFEKLEKTGDINSDSIEREIQARIDSVTSNCERLDILIYKEPLSRRTNGKLRIDQLKYDKVHLQEEEEELEPLDELDVALAIDSLKNGKTQGIDKIPAELIKVGGKDMAALDTYRNRKYQRLQEEREREALLNHHFEPNSYGETSIVMDQGQMFYAQKHQDSLQNANRGVDDMLQSGAGILENLRDQRMTIKGAHRRLYDIANTLGLSNTTMRLIERRAYQDKFILLGGMLFTLIVIGLVVVYFT
ncbi:hypothetical protein ANN_24909 [Periplaneta americana]|uniref:Golgi SNAP receptor complex member 2 n=1 Tax=Periplaneta americana TaxID=6978 RepID=A0ABQ8S033_PERAM|nr:hypothetical protein ANN_24909 [Periplaneta americana]